MLVRQEVAVAGKGLGEGVHLQYSGAHVAQDPPAKSCYQYLFYLKVILNTLAIAGCYKTKRDLGKGEEEVDEEEREDV